MGKRQPPFASPHRPSQQATPRINQYEILATGRISKLLIATSLTISLSHSSLLAPPCSLPHPHLPFPPLEVDIGTYLNLPWNRAPLSPPALFSIYVGFFLTSCYSYFFTFCYDFLFQLRIFVVYVIHYVTTKTVGSFYDNKSQQKLIGTPNLN
jgi:hypothetical protein